jgi:crossover junction endodeoxyribonuclease RusA
MILTFTVYGVPLPKGNHKAFMPRGMHHPIITESNRGVASWQQLVKVGASDALNLIAPDTRRLLLEGVRLTTWFVLPRPKSLPAKISAHLKAPDVDKLARAVCDAMTGVVYHDDNQVCELICAKRYAAVGEAAHVTIWVEPTLGVARTLFLRAEPVPLRLFLAEG